MGSTKFGGVFWMLVGLGLMGYWADRSFFHPTSEDRKYRINIAEYGGIAALTGNPPASIYLLLGVGAINYGSSLWPKR